MFDQSRGIQVGLYIIVLEMPTTNRKLIDDFKFNRSNPTDAKPLV